MNKRVFYALAFPYITSKQIGFNKCIDRTEL
jgi:hypothetical protein